MNIVWTPHSTDFHGECCYTHARAAFGPDGFGILTTQPLRLVGSDIFYEICFSITEDGGKTFSPLVHSQSLRRVDRGDGYESQMCDATPLYHAPTGKFLLLGAQATYRYGEETDTPLSTRVPYSVFDRARGDFTPEQYLDMPKTEDMRFFRCANGSGQSWVLPNGELLVPVFAMSPTDVFFRALVLRCAFDGERLTLLEIGDEMTVEVGRGLCEPSIVFHNDRYYLCLRNDECGYVAVSEDGLHYGAPTPLVFDDGHQSGNYNTQQHWITLGGKLYLVYTRRGADNDHVFRHRAPLFIAEFDPVRLCLVRDTEQIAVPNRGARLGNFGCFSAPDGKTAYVFASEWMQPPDYEHHHEWQRCAAYGSDNSIFITEITP